MIFGENLIVLLVLALGAALAVGNVLALLRPRADSEVQDGELARPPLGRSLFMILLGTLAAVWAIGSLLTAPDTTEESKVSPGVVATSFDTDTA